MPLYLQPKSEGESDMMTLARFWLTLDTRTGLKETTGPEKKRLEKNNRSRNE